MPLILENKRPQHNIYRFDKAEINYMCTDIPKKTIHIEEQSSIDYRLLNKISEMFNVSSDPKDYIYEHGTITTRYNDNGRDALLSIYIRKYVRPAEVEKDLGILA